MLRNLSALKDAQMTSLVSDSVSPYVSNHEYISENEEEGRIAALQRRLHPEKIALNREELDALVDNDQLAAKPDSTDSTEASKSSNNSTDFCHTPDTVPISTTATDVSKPSGTQDGADDS